MIGRTVGQYKIKEQLGSGGMGIVYMAIDTRLQREVALKFLPPHLSADENAKERFMQEARAASALDHANICTIYEIGEADDGQLFIAMAFYEGQTLKYILDERRIEPSEAVLIAHQIAAGLSRAHEAGIVHRDLKPANIMVTNRGEVKILDFGVAKLSESADLTKVGSTIGTAAYMSPEQARGEKVDARADIWSIGVLLYEMLAGERPFGGTYEAAFVYAIMNEEPGPIMAALPDGLADIVSKCLSKQPGHRYQVCADLSSALDPLLSPSGARHAAAAMIASSPPPQAPSSAKIAGAYAPITALILGFVYAVMIGFGLPDWVFQASVVLMVLGLPILLFAAHSERNSSGPSWLTFKRAVWGGVISISGLSLVTAGFMIMRIMGIGPAATLQSSGVLEENAKLIVAEFENSTSDPGLSESVSELLRIDLSQSAAINVMDRSDILSVLNRMNREANTKIDLNTAMEIAAREGAEAVVAGEISQLGSGYVLSARLLAAHDGSELLALRESAKDDGEIIAAMDRLSKDLRERIGESIKTIRSANNLAHVTTSSLDALRLYSQGRTAEYGGNYRRSLELLKQAVERDSTFAMAYRKLAVVYSNSGASPELQIEAAAKAYQLRDRLPARERSLTIANYYFMVEIDREKRVGEYENLIERRPDNLTALNNVAIDYLLNWEFERAEKYARRALTMGDLELFYDKLIASLAGQKRWAELDEVIAEFEQAHPDHPAGTLYRFTAAMAQDQYEGSDTLIRSSSFSDDLVWKWRDARARAVFKSFRGELSDWETESARTIAASIERGVPATALENYALQARITLDLLRDPERALQIVEDGLSAIPLESLHAFARPYSSLIVIYARLSEIEHAEQLLEEYYEVVPEGIRNGDFGRHLAEAEIMFARGQLAAGLETMRQVRTIDKCRGCFLFREGQILEQMDSLEAAVSTFTDFTEVTIPDYILRSSSDKAPAYFRLGELHSRLGNTDEAIEAYSKFVDIWINADSELQPQVAYARDRIGRLLDQSAREN